MLPENSDCRLIRDATMVLLFRLATIKDPGKSPSADNHAQAVLAVCCRKKATVENFIEFADMEKMRLLLLIKEQILGYLQKQFGSDAFMAILEDRRVFHYRKTFNHGINSYVVALHDYQENINSGVNIIENSLLSNIAVNAIVGQVEAGINQNFEQVEVDGKLFKKKIRLLFSDPSLGKKSIDFSADELPDAYPGTLYWGIFHVVVPELIINMKKYCPQIGEKELSINYIDNKIIFRNKIGIEPKDEQQNTPGGLFMCNEVLKSLNMYPLERDDQEYKNGYYKITLNLRSGT